MRIKRFIIIFVILLIVDYVLAVLHTERVVPLWTFLVANFPFGGVYVWFEAHWTGNQYRVGDRVISELWPFWTFFPIVFAQAWVYFLLLSLWFKKRFKTHGA